MTVEEIINNRITPIIEVYNSPADMAKVPYAVFELNKSYSKVKEGKIESIIGDIYIVADSYAKKEEYRGKVIKELEEVTQYGFFLQDSSTAIEDGIYYIEKLTFKII